MAIGLTANELKDTFDNLLEIETSKWQGMFEAAQHGEFPTATEILHGLNFKSGDENILGNVTFANCVASALLGTISANNEAIAKNLPFLK